MNSRQIMSGHYLSTNNESVQFNYFTRNLRAIRWSNPDMISQLSPTHHISPTWDHHKGKQHNALCPGHVSLSIRAHPQRKWVCGGLSMIVRVSEVRPSAGWVVVLQRKQYFFEDGWVRSTEVLRSVSMHSSAVW